MEIRDFEDVTFDEIFDNIPVGESVIKAWTGHFRESLDVAAEVIYSHRANPWVFASDAAHFAQFAGPADRAALAAMPSPARLALCGHWFDAEFSALTRGE